MSEQIDRRSFLKQSAVLAAAAVIGGTGMGADAAREMPQIRLGDLAVSRLLLGSNPFFGYAHRTAQLGKEMKAYFTPERIMATLDDAADHGITTVVSPPDRPWLDLWAAYRQRGGRLKLWISQVHSGANTIPAEIETSAKAGAAAIFIQGQRVDEQYAAGRFAEVRRWIEQVRSLKLPAGMASHRPDVHLEAQKQGFPNDFFCQCLYPNDDFRAEDRDKAVATLRQLEKPTIAYKVLAAGRNSPAEGFGFIGRHLRVKDGLCVGVYPKHEPGQVAQDARLTSELPAG